ncbi:MAG: hypothetical protein ACOY3K_02565 [Candidatus Omnitrophota bacterium]
MLLKNKKISSREQNWCLILNPLYSEIDKRKVSRKISEAFTLSEEEANDLVNNTPIILLDNLTQDIANRVKDYFRPTGAEILMTNEVYLKRKCYRTVWPEQPTLAFLHQMPLPDMPNVEAAPSEVLAEEPAIQEVRSLGEEVQTLPDSEGTSVASAEAKPSGMDSKPSPEQKKSTESDKQQLQIEMQKLRRERDDWRRKCDEKIAEIERMSREMAQKSRSSILTNNEIHRREQEIHQQKALLENMKIKLESLQLEYQQSRALLEEKLEIATQESQSWKKKWEALHEQNSHLSRDRSRIDAVIGEKETAARSLENRCQELETEVQQLRALLQKAELQKQSVQEALESQAQANQSWQLRFKEMEEKFIDLDRDIKKHRLERTRSDEEKKALLQQLEEHQAHYLEAQERKNVLEQQQSEYLSENSLLRDENEKLRSAFESQRTALGQYQESLKLLENELNTLCQARHDEKALGAEFREHSQEAERRNEELKRLLREEQAKCGKLEQEYYDLKAIYDEKAALYIQEVDEWKKHYESYAAKMNALEKNQLELVAELETRTEEAKQWENRVQELEKNLEEIRISNEQLEKMFRTNLNHLRAKEKELEGAFQRIQQLEAQTVSGGASLPVSEKKTRETELARKESRLTELVRHQQVLEQEIRHREESIRKILTEQEKVEQEILEAQQIVRQPSVLERLRSPFPKIDLLSSSPASDSVNKGAPARPAPKPDRPLSSND